MDSICSPEMPRRVFMASIAGGLLAAPLAAGRSGALARQTRWRYESWRDVSSIRSRRAGRGAAALGHRDPRRRRGTGVLHVGPALRRVRPGDPRRDRYARQQRPRL